MKRIIILTVFLLGLFFIGINEVRAQTTSIDGEWNAAMNTPGGVRNFKIAFKVDGEKLTGTVQRATGDVPLNGKIKGSDVDFTYTVRYNDHDLDIRMTGKVEGDSITGTVSFGESGQQDEWSAKRAVGSKPTLAFVPGF